MLAELTDLFEYDRWANHRILDACAALPAETLNRDLGNSFPSIFATLRHVASAEWIWLRRWTSGSPVAPPDAETRDFESVRSFWARVEVERDGYLAGLDEETLFHEVSYRNLGGEAFTSPLWKLMLHVVNHSTHHRGQVVTMLRQLGSTAPNTDLITYYRER